MSQNDFHNRFLQLEPVLKSFASSLTKDSEAAQDLYQETAYKAFKYRDKFLPSTNLKAWLLTIMKNTFINNYRRKKRQQTVNDYTENDFFLNSVEVSPNLGEGVVLQEELQVAIETLEEPIRVPFLMQFQGYQYDEIAAALNIPLGTVKSRIHIARRRLKSALQDMYHTQYIQDIL